jgi:hypothetical protein
MGFFFVTWTGTQIIIWKQHRLLSRRGGTAVDEARGEQWGILFCIVFLYIYLFAVLRLVICNP